MLKCLPDVFGNTYYSHQPPTSLPFHLTTPKSPLYWDEIDSPSVCFIILLLTKYILNT